MLTCKDFAHRVTNGVQHNLPLLTRWQMRLHLLICSNCRRFNRQMQVISGAMRYIAREPERYTQVQLPEPVRQRIQKKMREAWRQKQNK